MDFGAATRLAEKAHKLGLRAFVTPTYGADLTAGEPEAHEVLIESDNQDIVTPEGRERPVPLHKRLSELAKVVKSAEGEFSVRVKEMNQ